MTLDEAKNYLRIDFNDDDIYIQDLINNAQIYIDICVGEGYKSVANLVKLATIAQYKILNYLYDNRSVEEIKNDKIIETIFMRLANEGVAE